MCIYCLLLDIVMLIADMRTVYCAMVAKFMSNEHTTRAMTLELGLLESHLWTVMKTLGTVRCA